MISHKAITEFARKHPQSRLPLDFFCRVARRATWRNLAEVRRDFNSADVVGRRTIFNIKGNEFRLVLRINYEAQRLYILEILTHSQYSRRDFIH